MKRSGNVFRTVRKKVEVKKKSVTTWSYNKHTSRPALVEVRAVHRVEERVRLLPREGLHGRNGAGPPGRRGDAALRPPPLEPLAEAAKPGGSVREERATFTGLVLGCI